ncbi:hypothetical protein [Cellulomonas edaphi]|uniref:LPXTG cell wall anchor domain-containing protein n=1 Tax=Cellulomonas edaphi TaxID=3053468 RepID=A0ABT7S693_9CELL|nr:hypothetical protein [Cellulomons edaphi]MDM7830494.1 hypothetical protein [Cellulomons edaphi]
MTTNPRRFPALSAALAAALALGCVVLGASGSDALPQDVPLHVDFTELHAGAHAEKSWPVSLDYQAEVTSIVVDPVASGGLLWTATLCPTSGADCVDLAALRTGDLLDAGTYQLRVGVTVKQIDPNTSQEFEGRLRVREADAGLAFTGGSTTPLLLGALASGVVGVVLLLVGRRRRQDDADGQP